jgi:peptidyl-prolyl cis-trans isomerase A (cyclophilin A)
MNRLAPRIRALSCACALAALAPAARAAEAAPAPAPAAPAAPAVVAPAEEGLPAGLELQPGWYARIDTTKGTIVARLLPEQAPQTVAHFAALAEGRLAWNDPFTGEQKTGNYYDSVEVHLVEAGQRFEAGDRTGTGRGAPPFYVPPELKGPIGFDRPGRLGMTRQSLGRISGVQFFVTNVGTPWLRGMHPCFGEVVAGMDVVHAITSVKTGPYSKPIEPITIQKLRIHKVGDVPPLAEPVRYRPNPKALGPKDTK